MVFSNTNFPECRVVITEHRSRDADSIIFETGRPPSGMRVNDVSGLFSSFSFLKILRENVSNFRQIEIPRCMQF